MAKYLMSLNWQWFLVPPTADYHIIGLPFVPYVQLVSASSFACVVVIINYPMETW